LILVPTRPGRPVLDYARAVAHVGAVYRVLADARVIIMRPRVGRRGRDVRLNVGSVRLRARRGTVRANGRVVGHQSLPAMDSCRQKRTQAEPSQASGGFHHWSFGLQVGFYDGAGPQAAFGTNPRVAPITSCLTPPERDLERLVCDQRIPLSQAIPPKPSSEQSSGRP
jgi:hypothetical protein